MAEEDTTMYHKCLSSRISYLLISLCCACNSATPPDDAPSVIPLDGRGGGVIVYCYQPTQNGIHQIYGINADGTGNTKIITAPIGLNHHDVSPDGRKIVAVGYSDQTTWSIYIFNYDGTGLARLTTKGNVFDSEPVWSPDGARIAFTRVYPTESHRNEIWTMNADGSNPNYTGIEGFGARWSPDGARFIFTTIGSWGTSGLQGSDIVTSSIDGTDVRQITNTPGDEWYASWSPDGSRIVLSYTSDGASASNEIYVMNSDGTGRTQLTNNTVLDDSPRWSPDGSQIVFSSDLAVPQKWEVYIMNADGGNSHRITNSPSGITAINPVWVPVVTS